MPPKIISNFLERNLFNKIKKEMMSVPWQYRGTTADVEDTSNFLFYHNIYENDKVISNYYFSKVLMPILGNLNFKFLLRAKLNLYVKYPEQIKTNLHTDSDMPHLVGLYSFNTNNGYTEFENGEKIPSVENTMAIFPGNLRHRSVNQTDENVRLNLNINVV